jgi:hypothetical protein
MKAPRFTIALLASVVLLAGVGQAKSDYLEKFESDYNVVNADLLNHTGQFGEVTDFVYKKDVATITFRSGIIHFLRYIDDRPTTALFVGEGHIKVEVPPHSERAALYGLTGDSIVSQDFETCFIRFADDFDLQVLNEFTFELKQLSWKHFNIASKEAQGEFFFRPVMGHTYDNYFQLLRSIRNGRGDDGFFWVDFNRYIFSYDPGRANEVTISYEYEGGDELAADVVSFQSRETGAYADSALSMVEYPTTIIDRSGRFEMAGMDGLSMEASEIKVKVRVDADSLRFMSMFLHPNLELDSIYFRESWCDFHRRKDFSFFGVILPEYRYAGDTVELTLWYSGKQFVGLVPWVANPEPSPQSYEFITRRDYDYFMPGIGTVEEYEGGRQRFEVTPAHRYDKFLFSCYVSGLDTVSQMSDLGITLQYLDWELMNKRYSECFIPDDAYRPSVMSAFNFMAGNYGGPQGAFEMFVSPGGRLTFDMPGFMVVPQISCVNRGAMLSLGGVHAIAGHGAARQWFGRLMKPRSDREVWVQPAAAEYAGILYLQNELGAEGYSNLVYRRDSIYNYLDSEPDMPLSCGSRCGLQLRSNKGLWLLHMLRMLMFDVEKTTDRGFQRFMYELVLLTNQKTFTNHDVVKLAEKHYGSRLTDFFDQWLYGVGIPSYDVDYGIISEQGRYYIDADVTIEDVDTTFAQSVIMRVPRPDGQSEFVRRTIAAPRDSFRLGPFDFEPTELIFNEYFSVLCKQDVNRR